MRATSNHGGQGRSCGQPGDAEAEAVGYGPHAAAEVWLTEVDLCSGLPAPERIAAFIQEGRGLPLSPDGATALVELELLHSWLISHFGEDYARLSQAVRAQGADS